MSRLNVILCHNLTLSVSEPDNAAAKQGQELRSEQTATPLHESESPLLIFCVLTIRKHLLKMRFERSGRGQEPSRGHKFSILENLVLHRDFTSQTLASFDVILLGRACPKPCLERTRRNCVKLTQFLLSPCGSIGEITLGIFQRLFQKFLQLIRIIIHPMVRLRKFNIVVWNVVQNVRSH